MQQKTFAKSLPFPLISLPPFAEDQILKIWQPANIDLLSLTKAPSLRTELNRGRGCDAKVLLNQDGFQIAFITFQNEIPPVVVQEERDVIKKLLFCETFQCSGKSHKVAAFLPLIWVAGERICVFGFVWHNMGTIFRFQNM